MNADHDSVIIPALHDRLSDAGCRGGGFADESPDDGRPVHRADDPQYVADMQRLEAARAIGYVDAACLGCGCMLFVPEGQRCGDVLCNGCEAAGNALAADEDERPCKLCGGSAADPRHGGGYHASEVANQHEYEPAEDSGDDEPTPPGAALPIPPMTDPEYFGDIARRLDDNALVCGVHIADAEPHRLGLDTSAVQAAALSAFTAEVLRRLDARQAA